MYVIFNTYGTFYTFIQGSAYQNIFSYMFRVGNCSPISGCGPMICYPNPSDM